MSIAPGFLDARTVIEIFTHTKTATALHIGRDAYIQFANDAMLRIWGKDRSVIGKSLQEALPELKGQPFIEMFARVWDEGLTISGADTPAKLIIDGREQLFYFDFEYRAILDINGKTICILHSATDVTDRFFKQIAIDEVNEHVGSLKREQDINEKLNTQNEDLATAMEELKATNEELHATKERLEQLNGKLDMLVKERTEKISFLNQELEASNEEIRASNEELLATNEELFTINEKMEMLIEDLAEGERKFRRLIQQAPVAINVFKGTDLIIESANDRMLEIWNKTEAVEGKRFEEALPEIANQPFLKILHDVLETGIPYHGMESKAIIFKAGVAEERYFNFTYQPIADEDGKIGSILQVVTEVTEQVNARQEISEMNTRLNIAMDAGSLGSTEVDLDSGTMKYNQEFKRMFGKKPEEDFVYGDMFEAMLPEYRDKIRELVRIAKENHSIYKGEYQIRWPDGSLHWISAHGRARYDSLGNPVKMVGILSEVTEMKADEQRKNDFIGMVSHELKTPLTSLTGYVQLLQSKAKKSGDSFTSTALEKANNQLKKMTGMINSFLNVSRLESGKIHIEKQNFDLSDLISEMGAEFRVTTNSHSIIFHQAGAVFVNADRDKIGHVVTNLISNAVKYSPAGTAISINCRIEDSNAVVSVSDEGRGISKEDIEKLFERYYRVNDQSQTIAGFGIGLYLCSEILERHNGRIWVDSEPGKGSTFQFSLPI
ncbi:PAS domain S-box protein [Pedobacter sp. KBS0701]|uniref:ATP-binding protein n=1 Tax=Pedobacter sp. KBS0701 TaxID=2578106 RepID=UPI00110F6086|nr:ATP-binding protein [Pedobacter sp. KBS0701]QDW24385.1 PAS domain S-box protein [Pedobacter sp. KBS0701]